MDSFSGNRCCAPIFNDKDNNKDNKDNKGIKGKIKIDRCSKLAIGESDHCFEHRSKSKDSYLKYKKLQDKIENYKLKYDDASNLLKYYSLLISLYELRKQ